MKNQYLVLWHSVEYCWEFNLDKLFIKLTLAYLFNNERHFPLISRTYNLIDIDIVGIGKYEHPSDSSIFLVFFSNYFNYLFLLEPMIPVNDINILSRHFVMNVSRDLLSFSMLQLQQLSGNTWFLA